MVTTSKTNLTAFSNKSVTVLLKNKITFGGILQAFDSLSNITLVNPSRILKEESVGLGTNTMVIRGGAIHSIVLVHDE